MARKLPLGAFVLLLTACASSVQKPRITIEAAEVRSSSYAVFVFNRSDEPIVVSSIHISELHDASKRLAQPVDANARGRFDFPATIDPATRLTILHIEIEYFTDSGRFTDSCTCTVNYLRE